MATLHGQTARWPKSQAEKILQIILFSSCSITMLSGILIGLSFAYNKTLWSFLLPAAALLLVYIADRLTRKPLREIGKERIKHWRGAQTEAFVAYMIKMDLPHNWHLFNSINLDPTWDIDHILLGPPGIFVISTKSQRGLFSLAPDNSLLLNNQPCGFTRDVLRQTMNLRDRLLPLLGSEIPWLQPIVAVPFAYTNIPDNYQKVLLLHQENLIPTLESLPPKLSNTQQSRIFQALKSLTESPRSNSPKLNTK